MPLYCVPLCDGPVVGFDVTVPLQTIPRCGKSWGGRAARSPARYSREHGTLQFFAAFCPHPGRAEGRGTARKTSQDCRAFLDEVVLTTWRRARIHLILDNLSAHKAASVRQWAAPWPAHYVSPVADQLLMAQSH